MTDVTLSDMQMGIAAEVRAEIARQRLTLRDLAGRTGIGYSSLHRRTSGRVPFGAGELAVLAAALGVPVTRLYPPGGIMAWFSRRMDAIISRPRNYVRVITASHSAALPDILLLAN